MRRAPAVDLLTGSVLFRKSFVSGGHGHVDLPRLTSTGYRVVGMTVATTWPDARGTWSRWHFRSLGLPASAVDSPFAIACWLIGRIERVVRASDGQLRIIRTRADLEASLADSGPVGILLGVQGGHVLEGDLGRIGRLHELGVRMFAPAHVMDNEIVGSGTGVAAHGITDFGREVISELEAHAMIVDLAHMSVTGIQEVLPALGGPFLLSHGAIRDKSARHGRLRHYSPATRNVPADVAHEIGACGGLFGVVLSTQLLGGSSLDDAVAMVRRAIDAAGATNVALGSDMDGALRMLIGVEGMPALVDALLATGTEESVVSGFVGANAVRFLRGALPAG